MQCESVYMGPAPGLVVSRESPETASQRGVILLYHGYGAEISVNRKELKSFADKGFLALGIDNAGHGRRRLADWDSFFGPHADFETNIQILINQTIEELPDVIDALEERGWLQGRLGICGISMGGMIAYGGMLRDNRVSVGSVFVSSPRYLPEDVDVTGFAPRPLLSQTAGLDEVLPYQETEQLHEGLVPHYGDCPEKCCFVNYPDSGHMMEQQDWDAAWSLGVRWFERYLES